MVAAGLAALALLAAAAPAHGDPPAGPPAHKAWARRLARLQFDLASQLEGVPPGVREQVEKEGTLADAGQAWDSAEDDSASGLPRRRLILAGISPALAFVWYEQGGRGAGQRLLVFDTAADPPVLAYDARATGAPRGTSLADLESALARGALRAPSD